MRPAVPSAAAEPPSRSAGADDADGADGVGISDGPDGRRDGRDGRDGRDDRDGRDADTARRSGASDGADTDGNVDAEAPDRRLKALADRPAVRWLLRAAAAATLVWLVVLPLRPGTTNATLFTLTLMCTSVGVAINWNLTGGFTGYVDFGHAVWFGLGAYTTAIMMSLQTNGLGIGWPPIPAIALGVAVAGSLAAVIGRATMRLRGHYFSIAMLGTFVAMREIVRVWGGLTGGGVGLTLPPYLNRQLFYYIELVLVAALAAGVWWLRRTRLGTALVAIREDEVGAEMRGIATTRIKVAVFSFAGASTGLFGGLWAYQNTFVDPDIAFVEVRTLDAVMGTMLGGLGTVAGPIVGSVALYWLREVLWASLLDVHLIAQGVLLIVIVLFMPRGLVGLVDRRAVSVTGLWQRRSSARRDERPSARERRRLGRHRAQHPDAPADVGLDAGADADLDAGADAGPASRPDARLGVTGGVPDEPRHGELHP